MNSHKKKIKTITKKLKKRSSSEFLSLKKKTISHEVPKLRDKRNSDKKIDISDLDEIISIDEENLICIAEPGVTFEKLVDATLRYNLVPAVVSELKTITIGGAVAGCSIESMSYKLGGFHDNCIEYEVVTAKGDILICTPDNENKLIFQMMHGTFGTLGVITLLKFRLKPGKQFVKITYDKYSNIKEYKSSIWDHYIKKDVDFMDGIIHSPKEYVLSVGNFVDTPPYTNKYDWTKIYYKSTANRKEDYLETPDYFFRYNKGVTNVYPKSFIFRLLFGKIIDSNSILKIANTFRKITPESFIPITVDTFIPFSKIDEFIDWYKKEVNHFPLWCVPYNVVHKYEWISEELLNDINDDLFLDIALYGLHREDKEYYYKIIENKLSELGAIKTLISKNFYSEEEFWKIWNKENYDEVKKRTDPDNIFRSLYEKTCRASMGLD